LMQVHFAMSLQQSAARKLKGNEALKVQPRGLLMLTLRAL